MHCHLEEIVIGHGLRALMLENELLKTSVLLDKGADIYELIYKAQGIDVLWKTPWGLKQPGRGFDSAFDTQTAWLEAYAGGWQVLFPNGGEENRYKGATLGFHGEASMIMWDYEVVEESAQAVEVRLWAHLFRSPFRIERWMRVEAGSPVLTLRELISNLGGEAMDCMWSHHPAYGAPFLSEHCRIDIGAKTLRADDQFDGAHNPLAVDTRYPWSMAEGVDLARIPDEATPRHLLAYFEDFESGWYGITNQALGFGVGLVWDASVYPYAWFWQEMHASAGFPWYKRAYVMAIEPASSITGHGLTHVMASTRSHLTLAPGESREITIRTVFYDSHEGIAGIQPDGSVLLR